MKVALKGSANDKRRVYCEITITDGNITLVSPGVTYSIAAETSGMAKVALPFLYLVNVVNDSKSAEAEFVVVEGWLKAGNIKVAAKTTFLDNDRILRSVNLPLNYNDADLLKMFDEGYTAEELKFNKLELRRAKASDELEANIRKAYKVLKVYGITYEEIRKLVMQKLKTKVAEPIK